MARARRELGDWWRFVDVFVEVRDARAPGLTHNPDILELFRDRPYMVVMNKADLADPAVTSEWIKYFSSESVKSAGMDAVRGKAGEVLGKLKSIAHRRKGKPLRISVLGVSNIGKSSLINRIAGRRAAKVEARPGVTRQLQWIKAGSQIEIMDSPGLVPPRIAEGDEWGLMAALGVVPPSPDESEEVACSLIGRLGASFVGGAYSVEAGDAEPWDFLQILADKLSMKLKGGIPDTSRAASRLLKDFQNGKLPPVSLERPPNDTGSLEVKV